MGKIVSKSNWTVDTETIQRKKQLKGVSKPPLVEIQNVRNKKTK